MNDTLKKYLSEASNFMTDEVISEAKVDKDAAAVVIATEGKKEDADKKVAAAFSKDNLTKFPNKPGMFKKKSAKAIKEEEEEVNADALEEEKETDEMPIKEDEDDGAEDGEICEENDEDGASCNEEDEGEEEGDEMADDDQIEDPKKKKVDIKESYIANASRWM